MMRFGKVEALKAEGVHPRAWLSFDDHKKFPQHPRKMPAGQFGVNAHAQSKAAAVFREWRINTNRHKLDRRFETPFS
jgi:hypothetical protein